MGARARERDMTPGRLAVWGAAAWFGTIGVAMIVGAFFYVPGLEILLFAGLVVGTVLIAMSLVAKAAQIGFRAALRDEPGTRRS